jgi:hypothetical protein
MLRPGREGTRSRRERATPRAIPAETAACPDGVGWGRLSLTINDATESIAEAKTAVGEAGALRFAHAGARGDPCDYPGGRPDPRSAVPNQ